MEQRKAYRYDLRLPLELIRLGTVETDRQAETRNLSSKGILFRSKASLELGDRIEYVISLPAANEFHSEARLRCVGRIVRSSQGSEFAATIERYEFVRNNTDQPA